MDENTDYHLLNVTDIPELGRSASGVNSAFDNGNIQLLILKPSDATIAGLFRNDTGDEGYVMTYDIDTFVQTKRINKPKTIMKTDKYKITGIGTIDMSLKEAVAIFIGDRSTFSLHSRNFRISTT